VLGPEILLQPVQVASEGVELSEGEHHLHRLAWEAEPHQGLRRAGPGAGAMSATS
jgi:hypothetical protein